MESRFTRLARERAERRAVGHDDTGEPPIVAAGSSQPDPPPRMIDGRRVASPPQPQPPFAFLPSPGSGGGRGVRGRSPEPPMVAAGSSQPGGTPSPSSLLPPPLPPSAQGAHTQSKRSDALESAHKAKHVSPLQRTRCTATTRLGIPCRFPPRLGANRCINHESGANTSEASARAAEASAIARRKPSTELIATVFSLTDRASIQAVLDAVIRLSFANRLSAENARTILRACTIAARNFDSAGETLEGPRPQQHDWYPYFDKVQRLLTTIDPVLETAAQEQAETLAALTSSFETNSPSPGSGEGAGG